MAGTIQTITDRSAFDRIFYDNFSGGEIFLKTSNGNLKIAFLGYTSGQIAFRIPYIKSMPDTALIFARRADTTIYVELKTVEKQEAEVFIFSPIKVQIILASRSEHRASVGGAGEGKTGGIASSTKELVHLDIRAWRERHGNHTKEGITWWIG